MHLVPEQPEWDASSRAEQVLWDVLRERLPDDAALLWRREVKERGRAHEADLVVAVSGAGWAVVEVAAICPTSAGGGASTPRRA